MTTFVMVVTTLGLSPRGRGVELETVRMQTNSWQSCAPQLDVDKRLIFHSASVDPSYMSTRRLCTA